MSSKTAPPPYEREPLLSNADVTTAARDAAATAAPPIDPASSSTDSGPPRSRILRIVIVGFFIHMAVDFSQSFISVGLNQLVEGAACQQLYPDVTEPYADDRCKNEDVQSKLTLVMGWEMTFTLLPGLITAIPWGLFADRYGARAFLFIAFLGQLGVNLAEMGVALNPDKFDVRYVWLCTLFNFIGGGPIGYEAMQYTVANSITTESNRATIFFYLTALQIINQLISGPLTYGAMKIGPKFTQSLAVGCLAVGTLLVLALPGDISTPKKKDDEDGTPSSLYKPSSIAKYASLIRRLFRNNVQLGFLMFSLLFTMVGSYESVIRLQYSTDRYGYTWGEAGLVSSTTTIVNLLLIGVLLPIVSKWLLQTRTAIGKDIWLARFGIGALIVGSFATGLAPTRTLFVIAVLIHRISSSYTPAIISLIASVAGIRHADDEHASLVYLAVAFMRSAGQLIAGPLLAAFFTIGLRWGGAWLGLPFVFAGFLQILAGLIVFSVKDRSRLARYDEEEEEEEEES